MTPTRPHRTEKAVIDLSSWSPPFELRDYQIAARDALFSHLRRTAGDPDANPLIVAPTGSGKSVLIADAITTALRHQPTARILVLTHAKELVRQDADELRRYCPQILPGVCSAGLGRRDTRAQIIFGGVQTVAKRPRAFGRVDLLFVDEAHAVPHDGEGQYRTTIDTLRESNPGVRVIGYTATPYRLDGGYLTEGDIFRSVAYEIDVVSLIDGGYLSPIRTVDVTQAYDTSEVKVSRGEYVTAQLEDVVIDPALTDAAIAEALAAGADRRSWLVFASSVRHAEHVAERMSIAGVSADWVCGEHSAADRDAKIRRFKSAEIRALVNVGILTTGFNHPPTDLLLCLRPTQSAGLWVQMLGRGMRIAPGKSDCLLLDYGSNVGRHGPINRIQPPKMPDGEGAAPYKLCPQCKVQTYPAILVCQDCGYEWPPREIQHDDRASRGHVILRDEDLTWHDVDRTEYSRHSKEGKPDSVRVDYYSGFGRVQSEWVCLDHGGFATAKARQWITRRQSEDSFPPIESTQDLLDYGHTLWQATSIGTVPDGKYARVVDVRLAQPDATTERHDSDKKRADPDGPRDPAPDRYDLEGGSGFDLFEPFDDGDLPF